MFRNISRILLLLCLAAGGGAYGQLFRAYVSSSGSDGNPCTLAQPCRLLPAALNAVASGGEIWMLDSANFNSGTVNIGKSVSILALPGAVGSVVAVGGADAINISGAGVKVALRDLVIGSNAVSPGLSGIVMINGTSLSVDRCVFSNLPHDGIDIQTAAAVHVGDSLFRNIGTGGLDSGIAVGGGATAEIADTKFDGAAAFGLMVTTTTSGVTSRATLVNSQVTRAANCGVFSFVQGAGAAVLDVTRSAISNNNGGVCTQGGASSVVTLDSVAIHDNAAGGVFFSSSTSIVKSFGNNSISGNTPNITGGTLTATALQ